MRGLVHALTLLDGCPGCVVNTELPKSVINLTGTRRAAYLCSDCGHAWTTDWSLENVGGRDARSRGDAPGLWENKSGPNREVSATQPGPDHLPELAERG